MTTPINFKDSSQLKFIFDFDQTITKYKHENQRCYTTYEVLRELLPEMCKAEAHELYTKYGSLESSLLYEKQKEKLTQTWYEQVMELYVKYGVTKEVLTQSVEKSIKDGTLILREGINEIFEFCRDKEIPIIIFSAGICDVIEEFLDKLNLLHDNVLIVANKIIWNDQDRINSFQTPILHNMNKRFTWIIENRYSFEEFDPEYKFTERSNLILIGDSMNDYLMFDGLKKCNIYSIGLCNKSIDLEVIEQYHKSYYQVIMYDGSLKPIMDIISN